jgi:hypothetical protein
VTNVDVLSFPLAALACGGVILLHFKTRAPIALSSTLMTLVLLATYRVGHPQFHASVMLLGTYWLSGSPESMFRDRALGATAAVYWLWVSGLRNVSKLVLDHRAPHLFESLVGLVSFPVEIALICALVRHILLFSRA